MVLNEVVRNEIVVVSPENGMHFAFKLLKDLLSTAQ
jgi:hypothetical protein